MRYYSVKMRASKEGRHISGGERIVERKQLKDVVSTLLDRPSDFDFLNIKVELVKHINYIEKSLDIKTELFSTVSEANSFAIKIIQRHTGMDENLIREFVDIIHTGAYEGEVMRGAMIVDLQGRRLELDRSRGVRTTNVDFKDRDKVKRMLLEVGFTERTVDALCIATKNLSHPDILAEYCISDDPTYQYGYVATKGVYTRIMPLKEKGNPKGGRIYFVKKGVNLEQLYRYLEKESFLIEGLGDVI